MADALARGLHRERLSARKELTFSAPWREARLAPGDVIALPDLAGETFRVMRIEDGDVAADRGAVDCRRLSACCAGAAAGTG